MSIKSGQRPGIWISLAFWMIVAAVIWYTHNL